MISVEVRGADEVARRLNGAGAELRVAQERAVREASVIVEAELRRRMSGTGGSHPFFGRTGAPDGFLGARSGLSRARITGGGQAFVAGDTVFAAVGSPDKHIAFLEEGGTIHGNQFLRIPLRAAQTAQGVDRFAGMSIRNIPGAFLQRSRRGNLLAMRSVGNRLVEFLYLLVRSVRQKGHHVFREARKDAEPKIAARFQAAVETVVRKVNGG